MVEFIFWDVQHGSATYIRTPGGQHIVVDLGTGKYSDSNLNFSPLLHLKNNWGVQQLDGVIITHPHRDHLDDIFNFDALSPRVLWRPRHLSENDIRSGNRGEDQRVIDKYLEINKRYNITVQPSSNPFSASNNGGVEIKTFVSSSCSASNLNNHSIVTVISYVGLKMIIPGDNEPPSWDELLEQENFLSEINGTHIFVASHHGRKSGFSSALFEHINPLLTIISDSRFCDTSATGLYAQKTQGWVVQKRNGSKEDRKCVIPFL